jgi:hypothetical protein
MPSHPVLTGILVKFRVQLHQLTPNAFAQFSKYFWAVMSFGGKPRGDGFAKRYELHYQSKKVGANRCEKYYQFSCINFHGRRGSEMKLTPMIKNKWSAGWMKAWFYCKVPPIHLCEEGGKTVYVLRSNMCSLDFQMEPPFDCVDNDSGDVAFVQETNYQRS